ncbi:MAG: DUF2924 domain-containing protein [Pirellulaceae bacterium]
MVLNVGKEVAALQRMTVRELRTSYAEVFGETTRAGNKPWLVKRIAWRLQSQAEGDLSERARQRAAELANDADVRLSRHGFRHFRWMRENKFPSGPEVNRASEGGRRLENGADRPDVAGRSGHGSLETL